MRASWIFGAFALYETTVFADDTQYAMGGLDLPGTTYGCENGKRQPLNHLQPVPSPLGVNATACPSLDECQAGNMQCLEREQTLLSQLVSKQQELVDREKTLQEQLVAKQQELTNSERTLSAQLTAKQNELNNKKSYLFLSVSCRIETNNGMNTGGKPYQRLPNNSPVDYGYSGGSGGRVFDEMPWRCNSNVRIADKGKVVL
ncbi:hypothetical protein COCMIDRAFT_5067 [Bipolaris oryzae ATCC 44560]|uniref:Uncharacterized protein n=1 Tax=Bipolaris oryzae ATCC 44560 TaxID=930090 RepID=W6Z6Y8_COCMI|nr:uncharacterized protein COCMIDRAFT_5067 [Bipolaris oryzae ATCC 44560]EUC45735.1 hypothetical protein COCMIDRAFT_5067 [Bipolaris oryzae ATCC 44560]